MVSFFMKSTIIMGKAITIDGQVIPCVDNTFKSEIVSNRKPYLSDKKFEPSKSTRTKDDENIRIKEGPRI